MKGKGDRGNWAERDGASPERNNIAQFKKMNFQTSIDNCLEHHRANPCTRSARVRFSTVWTSSHVSLATQCTGWRDHTIHTTCVRRMRTRIPGKDSIFPNGHRFRQ